jgi:hypothetical protein
MWTIFPSSGSSAAGRVTRHGTVALNLCVVARSFCAALTIELRSGMAGVVSTTEGSDDGRHKAAHPLGIVDVGSTLVG